MSAIVENWIDRLSYLQVMLPVALILGLGVWIIYPRISSSDVESEARSPDGRAIAEVEISTGGGATEAAYLSVRLRSSGNPFRHPVFGGLDYGGKVTLSWSDSHHLLIKCQPCNRFDVKREEHAWRDISIQYEKN